MKTRVIFISLACLFAKIAIADNAGYVPLRKAYMRSLGGHVGAIGSILKAKINNADQVLAHAQALNDVSKFLVNGFPKDSNVGKSESKPEVWKNWENFKKKATDFQTASDKLLEAAKTKDMTKVSTAMGSVGESCKSCHKTFKKPD